MMMDHVIIHYSQWLTYSSPSFLLSPCNVYFEVYNPSNLFSESVIRLRCVSNNPGDYEYWNEFAAGAVILPNDVYVVAHPSSDPIILAQADETFII